MTRTLVTAALPYCNGPMHFGHLTGAYLPADAYVRTLRMLGEEVLFVCGGDEHGVAITINAEQAGEPYARYVARWRDHIKASFDAFGIAFDVWSGTSVSPSHVALSQEFFRRLDQNGYLEQRAGEQLYCARCRMFLADRYITGTCYVCGSPGARGDECPKCAAWLDPLKLREPACKVCGAAPERRPTRHWYLALPKLRDEHIGAWFEGHEWKPNVRAFVGNQLQSLEPRPITRDMRWGVPLPPEIAARLPAEERGKVLYVWFDAPIGYVSFTVDLFAARGDPEGWRRWWQSPDTRLVHFIGKDNIPFHCLVFPAMLWGTKQGYVLPWAVPANEFYNLQGAKFSTSGNWTIPLDELVQRHDAEVVRFHLLASAPESADSEWRWDEYQKTARALADVIGNLATRVLKLAARHFDGRVPGAGAAAFAEAERALLLECGPHGDPAEHVRAFRFRRACEQLLANAAVANVFVDKTAPWNLVKTDRERAAAVLAAAAEWIALLARWMAPFMPRKAQTLWEMLGQSEPVAGRGWPARPAPGSWRSLEGGEPLGDVQPLFAKLDDAAVASEVARLGAPPA
jgi:methionyl-tRNA synthetase